MKFMPFQFLMIYSGFILAQDNNIQVSYSSAYLGQNVKAEYEFVKDRNANRLGICFQINKIAHPTTLAFQDSWHSEKLMDHFGLSYGYGYGIFEVSGFEVQLQIGVEFFYTKFYFEAFAPFATTTLDSTGKEYLVSVLIEDRSDNMLSVQPSVGLRLLYEITDNFFIVNQIDAAVSMIYNHRVRYEAWKEVSGLQPRYQFGVGYVF